MATTGKKPAKRSTPKPKAAAGGTPSNDGKLIYTFHEGNAQMRTLLKNDLSSEATSRIRSVLHYNGLPIDARSVTQEILMQEGRSARQETVAAGVAGMTLARED